MANLWMLSIVVVDIKVSVSVSLEVLWHHWLQGLVQRDGSGTWQRAGFLLCDRSRGLRQGHPQSRRQLADTGEDPHPGIGNVARQICMIPTIPPQLTYYMCFSNRLLFTNTLRENVTCNSHIGCGVSTVRRVFSQTNICGHCFSGWNGQDTLLWQAWIF